MTRRGVKRRLSEEKWGKRGREAAGDAATSRSAKAFQFGNAKKQKPSWKSKCEKGPKKRFIEERGFLQGPHEEAKIHRKAKRREKN